MLSFLLTVDLYALRLHGSFKIEDACREEMQSQYGSLQNFHFSEALALQEKALEDEKTVRNSLLKGVKQIKEQRRDLEGILEKNIKNIEKKRQKSWQDFTEHGFLGMLCSLKDFIMMGIEIEDCIRKKQRLKEHFIKREKLFVDQNMKLTRMMLDHYSKRQLDLSYIQQKEEQTMRDIVKRQREAKDQVKQRCIKEKKRQAKVIKNWDCYGPGSCKINIFVRIFGKKTKTVYVHRYDRVVDIKSILAKEEGISKEQQRLDFHGRILLDKRTIQDYDIWENATLNLIPYL